MEIVASEALSAIVSAQQHRITDKRSGMRQRDGESFTQFYVDEVARYAGCSRAKADSQIRSRTSKFSSLMITGKENPIHFTQSCEEVQAASDFFEASGMDMADRASVGLVYSYDLNFRTITTDPEHPLFIFNSVMYDFINDVAAFTSLPSLSALSDPRAFAESMARQSNSRLLIDSMNSILGFYACNAEYQRSEKNPGQFSLIVHVGGNQMPQLPEPKEPRLQALNFQLKFQIGETLKEFAVGHEVAHACIEKRPKQTAESKVELEHRSDELALRYAVHQRLLFAARYSEPLPLTFAKLAACAVFLQFLGFYQRSCEIRRRDGASEISDAVSNVDQYPKFQDRASRATAFVGEVLANHIDKSGLELYRTIANLIGTHINMIHQNGQVDLKERLSFKQAGLNLGALAKTMRDKYGPSNTDS